MINDFRGATGECGHNRPIRGNDIARFFLKASAYLSAKQSEYLSPCTTSFGLAVAIALKLERFFGSHETGA
jgi:hypothetical protein